MTDTHTLTERRRRATRMRDRGATYAEIAETFGYSKSRAHADVAAGTADAASETIETTTARHLHMLAELRAAAWRRLDADETDDAAVDLLLDVLDHEARLRGLYPPAALVVTQGAAGAGDGAGAVV